MGYDPDFSASSLAAMNAGAKARPARARKKPASKVSRSRLGMFFVKCETLVR